MPQYIRAFVPGGTFFFTVTLLERRRELLTEHIANLREVFKAARQRRPFTIDAKGGMRFAFPPYGLLATGWVLRGWSIKNSEKNYFFSKNLWYIGVYEKSRLKE